MRTIKLTFAVILTAVVLAGTHAVAYERYLDGCDNCHGGFLSSISPKGTVFPSNSKHEMHRASGNMNTDCDLCHTQGDNRNPFLGSSNGTANTPGLGCTGCHEKTGLRKHHTTTGVTACAACHAGDAAPPPEGTAPGYASSPDTNYRGPCNGFAAAGLNENWSVGDFEGLDNDGDNLYDQFDLDCRPQVLGLKSWPDQNANGADELAALIREPASGKVFVYLKDSLTQETLGSARFTVSETPRDFVMLEDLGTDGTPDIAVLLEGSLFAKIKDSGTGALVSSVGFDPDYLPRAFLALGNVNGTGGPEIGVLGVNATTGQVRLQVKEAATGSLVSKLYFDPAFNPVGAVALADLNGNSSAEVAVLGTDADGRVRVQVKDSRTGALVGKVYFDRNYTPLALAAVPNNSGSLVAVGVLGRSAGGALRAQVKDPLTGTLVRAVFFDKNFDPVSFVAVPDSNGSGEPELSVLGVSAGGDVRVQTRDLQDGSTVSACFLPGTAVQTPLSLAVFTSEGSRRLGTLGVSTTDDYRIHPRSVLTCGPGAGIPVP